MEKALEPGREPDNVPEYTLAELAEKIGGTVEGDDAVVVSGLAAVDGAAEGDVTFIANPKYAMRLASSKASAAVVGVELDVDAPMPLIRVKDPNAAFVEVAACFAPPAVEIVRGVHERATVADDVKLGRNVSIGAGAVIAPGSRIGDDTVVAPLVFVGEKASIGKGCFIHPNVTIRERVVIGDRCIVHSGSVIGSDGFGYVSEGGVHRKIPQIGTVVVEDDVEIGACVTIDRARFDRTLIGRGSKIDNLVQVAHNVHIGRNVLIVSLVALAGSVHLGDNVTMGGQSAVSGHVEVGDNVVIAGRAGVTKDVPPNGIVSGFPAQSHAKELRLEATLRRLPELLERIKALEKRLGELDPEANDDR